MTEADKYRQFVLDNQDLIRQLAWTYAEKMSEVFKQSAASARKLAKELDRLCDEALDEDGD